MLEKIKITPLLDTLHLEDISDEIYFGKQYSGYISNSRLSLVNPEQGGTADKFIQGLSAVPQSCASKILRYGEFW